MAGGGPGISPKWRGVALVFPCIFFLGLLTSTIFTVVVIPVVYWLLYANSQLTSVDSEDSAATETR